MYSINEANVKNVLYSAQKSNLNKFNYKNFTSNLNQKYPSFPKKKQNAIKKTKIKSTLNDINMNMNNIKNIQINLNDNTENNNYIMNQKNTNKIIYINSGMNDLNNNKNNNYLNIILKPKQKLNNENKKFIRNLSGENNNNINIGYSTNNNQQGSMKKESSFINKILYIKNSNLFKQGNIYTNNRINYYNNISKEKDKYKNYKEFLSKSSFNDNLNNNSVNKQIKQEGNIKYIIPNKSKNNNNNNIKIDNLKKYIRKTEKFFQRKNTCKNELNLNNNNFLIKGKVNSTPIGDINFIFTNPNNNQIERKNMKSKNYIVRNSLIYDDNNDNNIGKKTSIKKNNKSNNNYIVNVNKYINIINKKNKIINKNNNNDINNGINIYNYNSYKIINNTNSINKKKKNNNFIESPNEFNHKKYKSINKNSFIPNSNSNYKDEFNINKINLESIHKNNFRTNTHTNPNQNDNDNNTENVIGFKKLKTINYINKNLEKNEKLYENKLSNTNLKNQRQRRFESDLKNTNIDSNSFNYFNKNNTNSSLLKGINSSYNNKNNKYANSRIYSESFSSSTKNLNSSQRNTYNYNPNLNQKINISMNTNFNNNNINNNIDRNTNYKKGRNEKYNLGIIFKPQTIGHKHDMKTKTNQINSNRNPKMKNDESNTNNEIGQKNNFSNNINNKNINFIKLMKTVNDYKNKSNKKQRYDNYIDKNSILQKKQIKFSYNPEFSNINLNNNFSEKKVIQNINQNTLTMYSIYIISHYFTDFNKIGLSRILILDKNKKSIPVICSNNNCSKDSNKLFLISNTNDNVNTPFITEFKKNIYINFYINNSHINDIKYIQIKNYLDIKNRVSPVGKIEIYQGKKLIFKGILNSNKISNIEIIKNKKNMNDYNNQEIQDLNDINDIIEVNNNNYINNRPYSISRYRSIEEDNMNSNKNKFEINNDYDNYYTTRVAEGNKYNNLMKNYSNDKLSFSNNNQLYNMENVEITDLENDNFNENNISNNDEIKNNINLDNIFTQKLSYEFSKSNKLNNIILNSPKNSNDKFETFNSKNSNNNSLNKINNSNSNKNINRINKENVTLNNNRDINHTFFNLFKKTYNKNEIGDMNEIFRTSINKLKDYSSFNLSNKLENNLNKENNTDLADYNIENFHNDSFNDLNFVNDNINNNNNIFNSMESPNYIEFNKIRFVITSNYGHNKFVGLTGIELFNVKSEQINIESALTIGALPKDLRTLYKDEKDQRIFENVFNKINNTNDSENMWVTRLKKNYNFPFVELYFKEKLRVSKIKIYNYNEKDKLNIGAKTIELYLDDEYYNTIYLKQGTGEIAYDFIKIENKDNNKKENNNLYEIDESETVFNEDFGQDIFFPIKNENDSLINISNNINNIKYSSFLYKQCYETPYLPSGYNLKLVLISNYYKGIAPIEEIDLLKYSDIGFNKIEIFDEEGINILKNMKHKIISNSEIFHNDSQDENDGRIIINGAQNENGNNCLFYFFNTIKRISYIKFYPLEEGKKPVLNSVKEIKIFCDCNIIFEGDLYLDKPTIILFTSEKKIIKDIDENYLTKEINQRYYKEERNEEFISLILN